MAFHTCRECKKTFHHKAARKSYCSDACMDRYNKRHYREKRGNTYARDCYLRVTYGLTGKEFEEKLARQGGVCAICGQDETVRHKGEVKRLSVDHNHQTGETRDLLCARCNHYVGYVEKWPELFVRISEYLQRHRQRRSTIPATINGRPVKRGALSLGSYLRLDPPHQRQDNGRDS